MTFLNKITWILGILMIFGLVISTNLIDRKNFIQVRDAVVTIYEDRLIAKDLIFDMSKLIHEKEMAIALNDSIFYNRSNDNVNRNMLNLITQFEQTKLTTKESTVFADLKENVSSLMDAEKDYKGSGFTNDRKVVNTISKVKANFEELSTIQIDEANRQMFISKQATDNVKLYTQIEIYLLIFLAIVIQIIVMFRPKD